MRLLLLCLLSIPLNAVIITVKTTGGDHPATEQGLRDALADPLLTCGSELQIEAGTTFTISNGNRSFLFNKDCPPGNEVTITTTMKAWLPDHDSKITPSYAPLLPTLYLTRNNTAAVAVPVLDVSMLNGPTKGIIIRGIALKNDPYDTDRGDSSYSVWMLNMGQDGVCDIVNDFASNLTAEHILYLASDYTYVGNIGGLALIAGHSVRVLNSWSNDARGFQMGTADSQGVSTRNGGTGYLIRNNHFGGAFAEHIIMGVGGPICQTSKENPDNITIEHNHFYNSLKWFPPNYVPAGGVSQNKLAGWMKNFVECKDCKNMTIRYNTGENQWAGTGGGQWHAVVFTPRGSRDQAGCSGPDSNGTTAMGYTTPHPLRVVLSGGGSTVTISYLHTDGTYHGCTVAAGPDHCSYNQRPGWAPGGGININKINNPSNIYTGWEIRQIATVADDFHFTVTAPFTTPGADVGYGPGIGELWDTNNGPFKGAFNIYTTGNYWKSIATDMNILLRDTTCADVSDPIGTSGGNIQYVNNLHVDSEPNMMNCCGQTVSSLKHVDLHIARNYFGDNFDVSHNTRYSLPGAASNAPPSAFLAYDALGKVLSNGDVNFKFDDGTNMGSFGGMKYNNNMNLPTNSVMDPNNWQNMVSNTLASQYLYNPAHGGYSYPEIYANCPFGFRQCANPPTFFGFQNPNVDVKFENENKNGFRFRTDSIFHNAGSDGKDTGADIRGVAIIQDLTVTPTDVAAWFQFVLSSGANCHLPAQIEVSAETSGGIHLLDDLGPYTTVNAVNPTMFMRSDSDSHNPRASPNGCARTFMVGDAATVTDDNAVSRDLRLTPNTTYYYRLSVGGAQERGQFKTTTAVTPLPWVISTATTTTHMKVQSGPNMASLTTGAVTPCGPSGCSFTLPPDANSRQMVYFIQGCNSGGTVSATWGPYVQMARTTSLARK